MTGAEKSTALLALATEADIAGLGLIAAALTQIARLDLDDPEVCKKWYIEVVTERHGGDRKRSTLLFRAASALRESGS